MKTNNPREWLRGGWKRNERKLNDPSRTLVRNPEGRRAPLAGICQGTDGKGAAGRGSLGTERTGQVRLGCQGAARQGAAVVDQIG
jgi:hypothetical protein